MSEGDYAEKASRRAYVMEMSPAYCDVIAKRWETLTEGKVVRVRRFAKFLDERLRIRSVRVQAQNRFI